MTDLQFMMGCFVARFPVDFQYTHNHMWASPYNSAYRFGFTDYTVRLLQDVYFLEWNVAAQTDIRSRQQIGSIESKKAESDLFAPTGGRLVRFNDNLMNDPSAINTDTYGDGWLFEIETTDANLMSAHDYLDHLAQVWEVTQRTIKGQF